MEIHLGRHSSGFNTEYSDNYNFGQFQNISEARISPGFLDGTNKMPPTYHEQYDVYPPTEIPDRRYEPQPGFRPDNGVFFSAQYPGIFRENIVRKDDRGKYLDTSYKPMAVKPYGRKLLYDQTHPDSMYASQWSSELADPNGCYSFPTTTGLDPEIPWTKDMSWQVESEQGEWPTQSWKEWSEISLCPTYDGHDDQLEYSQYKTSPQAVYSPVYPI